MNPIDRLATWFDQHLTKRQYLLLLSFLVGVFTAFAAQLLKTLIHEIEHLLTSQFDATQANWLFLVYPVVGILLTALFIKYIVRDNIGHGVTKSGSPTPSEMTSSILAAISKNLRIPDGLMD